MFRCHMKECHTHQSYSRCNGQRSNKAKKNASEAGEANHDLKQRRNHDSTLDLVSEQKYMWDYTSYYKSNYFIISLVLTYDLLEDKREDDIISIFFCVMSSRIMCSNKCREVLKTALFKPYLSHASFPNVAVADCRAFSGITIQNILRSVRILERCFDTKNN